MRALLVLLPLALLATPASAATYSFIMALHENPLHIAPDRLVYMQGDSLSILVGNPEENKANHTVRFDGYEVQTPILAPGRAAYLNFTLDKAGEFEYYCTIPGHRDGGQRGTMTVEATSKTSNSTPYLAAALVPALLAGAALVLRGKRA